VAKKDNAEQELAPKIAGQVDVIRGAFRDQGIEIGILTADQGVSYMYANGQLLVREEYLEHVRDFLGEPRGRDHVEAVIPGIVLLKLTKAPPVDDPEEFDRLIARIDQHLGEGVATPNHVLTVAGEIGPCPATEPQGVYADIEPFPSARADNAGAGVRIYIADTGLLPEAKTSPYLESRPWLAGVRGENDPLAPPAGGPFIQPYAVHGTFVAGVVRCVAPGADICVSNIFQIAGSALENDFVRKLERALHRGYDIFHISVTAPTRNDRPMRAFKVWLEHMHQYKGVVCVAAAGNSGSHLPSWPAAFGDVVSVGALAADWRSRALFSNYGGWVDVYAPGRNIVNAYVTGTYKCKTPPYTGDERKFYGMAKWSGTSFSTPIVTGLIAARMTRTGENGQEAAAALLAQARSQAIPGVGAILLPYGNNAVQPCGCGSPGWPCGCELTDCQRRPC
jgi:subtilisin family serine protease